MRALFLGLVMIGTLQAADKLGLVVGEEFDLPLPMGIDTFIEHSIGHIPKAIIKDGLPFFGSKRGDFKRQDRRHKGYDIYVNHSDVIASATGKVIEIAHGKLSGTHIKLQHKNGVETLYIHLTSVFVTEGKNVKKGDVLGRIDGAAGNAVAAQLHYEIKVQGVHQDPLYFIKERYPKDSAIAKKITIYEKKMKKAVLKRDGLVREFLKSH